MLKLLILGIGLLLFFEGLLYYFLANKLKSLIAQLEKVDPQRIKTISLIMTIFGACLIYFIFSSYGEF
tara:strand:+ start:698 stop:901 length:204 start_codon:yes stop_codon:yes gene_type:complete